MEINLLLLTVKEQRKTKTHLQGRDRETFVPELGARHPGDRQEEPAAVIAHDGCPWMGAGRHFVLVASFKQVLTAAFLQGLRVHHVGSKGTMSLQNQSPNRQWERSLGIRIPILL